MVTQKFIGPRVSPPITSMPKARRRRRSPRRRRRSTVRRRPVRRQAAASSAQRGCAPIAARSGNVHRQVFQPSASGRCRQEVRAGDQHVGGDDELHARRGPHDGAIVADAEHAVRRRPREVRSIRANSRHGGGASPPPGWPGRAGRVAVPERRRAALRRAQVGGELVEHAVDELW